MGNVAIFKGKLVKFLAKAGILIPARPNEDRSLTPDVGETAFNTTANKLEVFNGATWDQLSAGGGGGGTPITVKDETTTLTTNLSELSFAGEIVAATNVGSVVTVTVDGNTLSQPTLNSTFERNKSNVSMTGQSNTGIGVNALNSVTVGISNTSFGYNAGTDIREGVQNVTVGANSGSKIYDGDYNIAIGASSMSELTDGNFNVAIGVDSLDKTLDGQYNVAIGHNAGINYTQTSSYNTLINSSGPVVQSQFSGTVAIGKDSFGISTPINEDNEFILGTINHKYKLPGIVQSGFNIGQSTNTTSYVTLQSAVSGSPVTWTLPVSNGNSGDVLTNNGSGTLSWLPAGSGSSIAVKDEGSTLTAALTELNFVGSGVTATNLSGAVTVTIPGGGGSISVQDESSPITSSLTTLNFTGNGVSATAIGGVVSVNVPGYHEQLYAGNALPYYNKILTINTTATFSGNFNNCVIYSANSTLTFTGTLYNCIIISVDGIIEINCFTYSCKIQAEIIKLLGNAYVEDSDLFAASSLDMASSTFTSAFYCNLNTPLLRYLNDCTLNLYYCIVTISDARLNVINRLLRLNNCTATIGNLYLYEGSTFRALEIQNATRLNIGILYHAASSNNLLLGINVISGTINLKSTINISTLTSTDIFSVTTAQLVSSSLSSIGSLMSITINNSALALVVSGGTHSANTTSLNLTTTGGNNSVGIRLFPTPALNSLSW